MNPSVKKHCEQGAATSAPFAVLVVNLGSPDTPDAPAVRRYLREFLSDTRVVDLPRWIWWPILYGFILRFRPSRLAGVYKKIWRKDAPLREHTQAIADKLALQLERHFCQPIPVATGMTYGQPTLRSALLALRQSKVSRVLVLPLYPQFSSSTTAAVFDKVTQALQRCRHLPELRFIKDYYADSAYINALAQSVEIHWQMYGRAEKLLMSFHGLPQRFVTQGDPYALQCEITAQRLARKLNLRDDQWQLVFQSRFGREAWLQPYADEVIDQLARKGLKTLDVICPGFAADCLETLEEISLRADEQFREAGGERLRYIPALNDSDAHITALLACVNRETNGWSPIKSA